MVIVVVVVLLVVSQHTRGMNNMTLMDKKSFTLTNGPWEKGETVAGAIDLPVNSLLMSGG